MRIVLAALLVCACTAAQAQAVPEDLRGVFAYPECASPDELFVLTDRHLLAIFSDETQVYEVRATPAQGGWTRFETQGDDGWWEVRRLDRGGLEERWPRLEPGAAQPAAGISEAEWDVERAEACKALPPQQSLLHGEAITLLRGTETVRAACIRGPDACAPAAFALADVTGDGRLSIAEIARIVRVGAYFAALGEEQRQQVETLAAAVAAMIPVGPLAGAAFIGSFDYDGDGSVSLPELLHDRADLAAGVAGIAAGDTDLARAIQQLGALEQTVRGLMR